MKLEKGGVDCEVSRRERDFPNTYSPIPTSSSFANSKLILCSPRLWQDLLGPLLQEFDPIHWIFCIVREEGPLFSKNSEIFQREVHHLRGRNLLLAPLFPVRSKPF